MGNVDTPSITRWKSRMIDFLLVIIRQPDIHVGTGIFSSLFSSATL